MRVVLLTLVALAASPALAEPPAVEETAALRVELSPHAVVVGGVQVESITPRSGTVGKGENAERLEDHREDRVVTVAMSRLSLRGRIGEHVELESELEVNRGPHGTSVWEGQAALQVRAQRISLYWRWLALDLGRFLDPASVDFTSVHVADQLLMDPYTRQAMLESGYNLGNGLKLRVEPLDWLSAGLALNASNPTGSTASYLIAGKYSSGLFTRFVRFAASRIAASPSKYPDDSTHLVMLTPSLRLSNDLVEARVAAQLFTANVDTNVAEDDAISGYNLRAGVIGHLLDDSLRPFVNGSLVVHTTLAYTSDDATKTWAGEDWRSAVVSAGLDWDVWDRHGVGVQVARVAARQGDGSLVESSHTWVNVGATFWLAETIALAARFAWWSSDQQDLKWNNSRVEWEPLRFDEGESSVFLTLRKVL